MDIAKTDKTKAEKLRAIRNAMKQIAKTTKKDDVVQILGEKPKTDINVISTGSLMFDIALGIGGIASGRVIEFFGGESSGKTLCALKCAAECQKTGGMVAFVDME